MAGLTGREGKRGSRVRCEGVGKYNWYQRKNPLQTKSRINSSAQTAFSSLSIYYQLDANSKASASLLSIHRHDMAFTHIRTIAGVCITPLYFRSI